MTGHIMDTIAATPVRAGAAEPPHPKAIELVKQAYAAKGTPYFIPLKTDAEIAAVKSFLQTAAAHLGCSVTVRSKYDEDDYLTGLSYTANERRARKSKA